ncbi:MAG: glycosyltransferase family 9 protein [Alphaproteobacteria bacterium]|nr:glycosyltransferase family 9 protein [Alphaproteobacteria bacterium]
MTQRILLIKLGALGDFAQAFGPFAAIRTHHPGAEITLLTTAPFAPLARQAPWFDRVWDNGRPRGLAALWALGRRLRAARFDRVYDLQTSGRSSRYRWLIGRSVEWSGIAAGASHPHANPRRDFMHTVERQREQLAMAGISHFPAPELAWLDADITRFALPEHFALLIPGASPGRPAKRWPVEAFGALAGALDLPAVILGGPAEAALGAAISQAAPSARDLTGQTSFADIAALARRAAFCIGNDTGPTHLAAVAGCPTLALFGEDSDPALCAPRGPRAAVLRRQPLSALPTAEVKAALQELISSPAATA